MRASHHLLSYVPARCRLEPFLGQTGDLTRLLEALDSPYSARNLDAKIPRWL